jgi:hypothetical protein
MLLARQGNGDIFNASKGALPMILPAPRLETLSLSGYLIDAVNEIGDDHNGIRPCYGALAISINTLLKMPKTSHRSKSCGGLLENADRKPRRC